MRQRKLVTREIALTAVRDSFAKLDPRTLVRNPVIFIVELGAVIARGQPNDVINDPLVVEGYLGGSEDVIFRSGTKQSPRKKAAGTSGAKRRSPLKAAAK